MLRGFRGLSNSSFFPINEFGTVTMAKVKLNVNGTDHEVEVAVDQPLLWVLRDELKLVGTKFGCGMAQCGACTEHLNGQPQRSCSVPAKSAVGMKITTIEGLAQGGALTAIQKA